MVCGWGHPASDLKQLALELTRHFDISILSVHELAPAYSEKLGNILKQKQAPATFSAGRWAAWLPSRPPRVVRSAWPA